MKVRIHIYGQNEYDEADMSFNFNHVLQRNSKGNWSLPLDILKQKLTKNHSCVIRMKTLTGLTFNDSGVCISHPKPSGKPVVASFTKAL